MEFIQSSAGYVVLGGVVAALPQTISFMLTWFREALAAKIQRRLDAEQLAIKLVIKLDEVVAACVDLVEDPMLADHQGLPQSTVKDPDIILPAGQYTVFPSPLMFGILSLPSSRQLIEVHLARLGNDCDPLEYAEFYRVRAEYFAHLGLQALDLINQLSERYHLPAIQLRDEPRTRACLTTAIQATSQHEPSSSQPIRPELHAQLAG
ncbi:hypothetical protein ACW5W8_21195 [Aeromonas aquatilis]